MSKPKSFAISKRHVAMATEFALPNMEAARINNRIMVGFKTNHPLNYIFLNNK